MAHGQVNNLAPSKLIVFTLGQDGEYFWMGGAPNFEVISRVKNLSIPISYFRI